MSTDATLPPDGTDSGETATLHSGEASVSAIGSGALTWTEEKPRAGGGYGWMRQGDRRSTMVEVSDETDDRNGRKVYGVWIIRGGWIGTVDAVGGWWCGPVEMPEPPLVATRQNVPSSAAAPGGKDADVR